MSREIRKLLVGPEGRLPVSVSRHPTSSEEMGCIASLPPQCIPPLGGAAMSLADKATDHVGGLIQSGELPPGSTLPPEQRSAAESGLSRNLMREAVKALVVAGAGDPNGTNRRCRAWPAGCALRVAITP